jgi:hypothetical protein
MWFKKRKEREAVWAADHARFEELVVTKFGERIARFGFDPGLSGTPYPVGHYAVLFEEDQPRDPELGSDEIWLNYFAPLGYAEVWGAVSPGFRAPARSEDEALQVFKEGVARLEEELEPIRLDIHQITVEGELFEVSTPANNLQTRWFKWLSGPNEDYGFMSGLHGGEWTPEMIEESARDFLSQIDPNTGYIGDD